MFLIHFGNQCTMCKCNEKCDNCLTLQETIKTKNYIKEKTKKYDKLYMDIASRVSKMSFAKRLQVASVIVKDNNIISFSWNGTAPGRDNTCENKELLEDSDGTTIEKLVTKDEVIHSEMNSICKAASMGVSLKNSTMYLTHAPCINCAKHIVMAGISRVVFKELYRDTLGIDFLNSLNIKVEKFDG